MKVRAEKRFMKIRLMNTRWKKAQLPADISQRVANSGLRRAIKLLRALVLGLRSCRRDHLTVLFDAIFGHAVMEDRAETEIPS